MVNEGPYIDEKTNQIAEQCLGNLWTSYPPIQERTLPSSESADPCENYHFSIPAASGPAIRELLSIVLENPGCFISRHAERHEAELKSTTDYLIEAWEKGNLQIEYPVQYADLKETPNGFARIPRYLITTKESMERTVTRFLPIEYAIELSDMPIDSKSKTRHIRQLLGIDPGLGIMTGIALLRKSSYTETPEFLHADFFRVLGNNLNFFRENNPEHREAVLRLVKNFGNIYDPIEYQQAFQSLSEFFPNISRANYGLLRGTFQDSFKPLILFGSSEDHLQSYLNMHPEISLTAGLVERLSTKGALGRWTSNIISMYLRHERAQQVLSKCHTKDDWGILNYLPKPQA